MNMPLIDRIRKIRPFPIIGQGRALILCVQAFQFRPNTRLKHFLLSVLVGFSLISYNAVADDEAVNLALRDLSSNIAQAQAISAKQSRSPNAWVNLANAQFFYGEPSLATNSLNRAFALDKNYLPAIVLQARMALRSAQYDVAQKALSRAESIAPRALSVTHLRAEMAMEKMDYIGAKAIFQQAIDSNAKDTWALTGLAEIAYWEENFELAKSILATVIDINPALSRPWMWRSLIERIEQKNKDWAVSARLAVRFDPSDDAARVNLAMVLVRGEQKPALAQDQFRIALALNPWSYAAHREVGNGWSKRVYPDLKIVLPEPQKTELEAILESGRKALDARESKNAAEKYSYALTLLPDHVPTLIGLATSHFQQQQWTTALSVFEKILKLDPDYGLAHYGSALCLMHLRDTINVRLQEIQQDFSRQDAPEPPRLREVLTSYSKLDPDMQKIVRVAVHPLRAFLPALADKKMIFVIFPLHQFLWEMSFNSKLKGTRTFDGRLWDDVKGSGGNNATAGEEWVRDAKQLRFNVLAHEFAHQVHASFNATFKGKISQLYQSAKTKRLTLDFYSNSNEYEYFAVGIEAYVSEKKLADQKITYGHIRSELKERDPELFAFIVMLDQMGNAPITQSDAGEKDQKLGESTKESEAITSKK